MSSVREVVQVARGEEALEGAGVRIRRFIGTRDVSQWDPFLLLDEFKNDDPKAYVAGFPDHPHRGFETVTYMLAGAFRHRDSRGNEGHLSSGGVQWMTAGRGIIHSEMPEQEKGLIWGYQLWLNLPARLKMTQPAYQDIPAERIPHVSRQELSVKVIAGTYAGQTGPAHSHTPILYFDVDVRAGTLFEQAVPASMNSFVYPYEGSLSIGSAGAEKGVEAGEIALLGKGDQVRIVGGRGGGRFLFLAAQRLEEPVARAGPFVMNTRAELAQAFEDYETGALDR